MARSEISKEGNPRGRPAVPTVLEPWAASKKLYSTVAVPQTPVRVPSQCHLPESHVSHICGLTIRVIMR